MDDANDFATPNNEDEPLDDTDDYDVDSNQSLDNIDDYKDDEEDYKEQLTHKISKDCKQEQQHDYDLTLSSWSNSDKLSDKVVTLNHDFSSKTLFNNMTRKSRLHKRICKSAPIIATKILTRNLKVTSIQCAYLDAATHELATRVDIN